MHTNSSTIDLEDAACQAQAPGLAGLDFREWELAPGEALYIPPRWWHFVKATTVSFSVSFWWT